jgi:hypothetical protein
LFETPPLHKEDDSRKLHNTKYAKNFLLQILEKFLCDILAAVVVAVVVVVVAMDPGKPSDDIWFPAQETLF